jgi:rubrerythrin
MKKSFVIPILFAISLFPSTLGAEEAWGATAAKADSAPTVSEMLRYAIEDEYLAREEYSAILRKFGSQRPFSNIVKSEERHIAWIEDAYRSRNLALPADRAAEFVIVPASMIEALRAGVQAEIANIAMYGSFLAKPEISLASNRDLRDLFTRLRSASENHLAAFRRGLGGG